MRKLSTLIISTILFLSLAITAQAQSPVDFGVKGGINLADLANFDEDFNTRTGLHAGLVLDFSLPMMPIGIESGVYYSQKGSEATYGSGSLTFKLDYIEVPVMAKINVGPPGPFTPHILAGPYAAYNINAELEGTSGSSTATEDASDFTTDVDFGGIVGVGADFNAGVTKLNVQARYSRGFVDINDNGNDDDGVYHNVFTISAGIMF